MPKKKLDNLGAAVTQVLHLCVVCSADGGTRLLSAAIRKEPCWRATLKKHDAGSLWVCHPHRKHGPKGQGDRVGRGGVAAGPDPSWPKGKKWHPGLTETEAEAMVGKEMETAAAHRDEYHGLIPDAGDYVSPGAFLRCIEQSNDPQIRRTTALTRRSGSGLEVDHPPCLSPQFVTITKPGGKGTREAFYSAQGIRVTDPRATGGWVRHDNTALFDQCRHTACQVGSCGKALIPHWWVPLAAGHGAVVCALKTRGPTAPGDDQH